jgi:hypothetical protein
VLRRIKANLEYWHQAEWHCGTTHCFAGFAEISAARVPITIEVQGLSDDLPYCLAGIWSAEDRQGWPLTNASKRARHYLGLTYDQAEDLFYICRTLDDLERKVEDICNSPYTEKPSCK